MEHRITKPAAIHPDSKADMLEVMPIVNIEDIPPHRRKQLLEITEFTGLETDEWFEEWLAVWLNFEFEDIEQGREVAWYYRKLFKMKQDLESWRHWNLSPLDCKLFEAAKQPHFHYSYLYELELRKIECMRRELTNRGGLDSSDKYWISIAIKLLQLLVDDGNEKKIITKKKLKQMNIRNIKGLVHQQTINEYINETDGYSKYLDGVEIYKRKIERLYYQIRLHKTRTWWI